MVWNEIKSMNDVNHLNSLFSNFHDSYLKELCYSSGSYVCDDLAMHDYNEPIVRFLFQRIWENPSVIEVEFRDVLQVNIKPAPKGDFSFILDAPIHLSGDTFYWNANNWSIHDTAKDMYTWVLAKKTFWRVRDNLLGYKKVYQVDKE